MLAGVEVSSRRPTTVWLFWLMWWKEMEGKTGTTVLRIDKLLLEPTWRRQRNRFLTKLEIINVKLLSMLQVKSSFNIRGLALWS